MHRSFSELISWLFFSGADGVHSQWAAQAHLLDSGGQSHWLWADAAADGGSEMGH